MKRPSIKTPCVADHYHRTGERIAEVTLPDGRGFLMSVDVEGRVCIYRADAGLQVSVWGTSPRGKTPQRFKLTTSAGEV